MGCAYFVLCAILLAVVPPSRSSPIMVSFGTKGGPIVPPTSYVQTAASRSYFEPAPVHEYQPDTPNPPAYTALAPGEYRTKLYKYRPNPNLILGTPLDRKYSSGFDKYSTYRKPRKAVGLSYTGPQTFTIQDYERDDQRRYQHVDVVEPRTQVHSSGGYGASSSNSVPQIGIVYSSGVRYYVPQFTYYDFQDGENSVYDSSDLKYYQHQH